MHIATAVLDYCSMVGVTVFFLTFIASLLVLVMMMDLALLLLLLLLRVMLVLRKALRMVLVRAWPLELLLTLLVRGLVVSTVLTSARVLPTLFCWWDS